MQYTYSNFHLRLFKEKKAVHIREKRFSMGRKTQVDYPAKIKTPIPHNLKFYVVIYHEWE